MNSWVKHYMVQDKGELVGMLLSRDEAIKLFEKKLHNKDKEIERLNNELELQNIEMGREIERLNNEIKRQEDVITNLNDDNEYLTYNINSLEVENTRLNNIIERLKHNNNKAIDYLKSYIKHYNKGDKECMLYSTNELLNILGGSDKE